MDAVQGDSQVITQLVTMSIKPEHDAEFVEFARAEAERYAQSVGVPEPQIDWPG